MVFIREESFDEMVEEVHWYCIYLDVRIRGEVKERERRRPKGRKEAMFASMRKVYVEEALVLNVMKDGAKWFPNEIF